MINKEELIKAPICLQIIVSSFSLYLSYHVGFFFERYYITIPLIFHLCFNLISLFCIIGKFKDFFKAVLAYIAILYALIYFSFYHLIAIINAIKDVIKYIKNA